MSPDHWISLSNTTFAFWRYFRSFGKEETSQMTTMEPHWPVANSLPSGETAAALLILLRLGS